MNRTKIVLGLLTIAAISVYGTIIWKNKVEEKNLAEQKIIEKRKVKAMRFAGAAQYYHMLKANYQTGEIDFDALMRARKFVGTIAASKAVNLNWVEMGPNNVGGRVRAILIDKDNSQLMYAGGVAGGLWKSTTGGQSWTQIPLGGNIAVSCITQAPNGDIYVGTGEGLAQAGSTNYNTGSYGLGIYKKEAASQDFVTLNSTTSWKLINRIAVDNNGKVYAATANGLKTSIDNGTTWVNAKTGSFADVKAAKSGNNVVATSLSQAGNCIAYLSTDGNTWVNSSLPSSGLGRIEIAISPSNSNYVYAVLAASNGSLQGVYRTTDFGGTWTQIGVGGTTSFQLFGPNNQGWYDNVAMVHPTNPDVVYVGGVDMWKGEKITDNAPFNWTKVTLWNADESSSIYVHADQHVYTQHPTNPAVFYQGTDGGISKTSNYGQTFASLNKNFNVTQFYSVAPYANGGAIAGAQDNGTQFLHLTGNNVQQATKVRGGDGGWAATSTLNQKVIFASIYYGDVARSNDYGVTLQEPKDAAGLNEFYNTAMNTGLTGSFVTPCLLWETISYPNSIDSVNYIADQNYAANAVVDARSFKNNFYPFPVVLQNAMQKGDTLRVMDKVQSRFFIGTAAGIYMTKDALYFAVKTPEWFLVSKNTDANAAVFNMKVSKDGNVLYYTTGNNIKRLSGILEAQDSNTADFNSANYVLKDTMLTTFPGFVSSIYIDPTDNNKVVVTLGGTGNQHIYYSNNALSVNPTFSPKLGNLTVDLPVYASLIPIHNSNTVIIGTEHGMYATDNIAAASPIWSAVNSGVDPMVPVYFLTQQTMNLSWRQTVTLDNGNPIVQTYPGVYNYGQIYAATHGRGIFTATNYLSATEQESNSFVAKSSLNVYPNPANNDLNINMTMNKSADLHVNIYDISGRFIASYNLGNQSAGELTKKIDVSNLSFGTYIIQVKAGSQTVTQKFIKN